MSNVVRFPSPAVRAIDEPSVRSYAEAFMRTLRTNPHADRIPIHLYMALVDTLDAIVMRMERDNG